jgi:hypothetical protein
MVSPAPARPPERRGEEEVWEEEVAELQRERGEVLRREEGEKVGHGARSWLLGKERQRKGRRKKKMR